MWGGAEQWHIQADALEIVKMEWDMVLAFPPCTHLAVSGASWFSEKQRDGRQQMGIGFFLAFTALDHVQMVAIENPIGIMSSIYRKPDQVIQPWQFGEPYTKQTCLWLKNLPKLEPTNILECPADGWENQNFTNGRYSGFKNVDENGKVMSWSDPRTATERSKTFPGIAKAMAEQWGSINPETLELCTEEKQKQYTQIRFNL